MGVGDAPPSWILAGKTAFDGTAATSPDTLWRIYSMTKPITGIAAMILVDEGKLKLDQPVSDFFPEFATARVLIDPTKGTDTRPATRTMTIRDLMTHTSGLNYAILAATPAQKELQAQGVVPFQANPVLEAKMRPLRPTTLMEFAARAGRAPLVADPETAWNYSMGLDVLGAVIEKASGVPFDQFVQRRILDPLGMTSTEWQVKPSQVGRFAANYGQRSLVDMAWPNSSTPVNDKLVLVDSAATSVYLTAPSFPYGGAGLVSTARDYDRFLHMLLNDGRLGSKRILSEATARLAKSNLMPRGVLMNAPGPIAPGKPVGFGAGGLVTLEDVDAFGRGKGTYGWDGAAGTRAWVDPVRHIRAVMMINLLGAGTLGTDFDKAVAKDMGSAAGK
ncbi:serine hydrolase domain-containing protein [Sphingomonas panacisoli]|uniref:serine hydrolase domain-containing protein n=1 Tax=Sphingomonas panacisoli TaxID=1813879 RepID=UPI0030B80FE3